MYTLPWKKKSSHNNASIQAHDEKLLITTVNTALRKRLDNFIYSLIGPYFIK